MKILRGLVLAAALTFRVTAIAQAPAVPVVQEYDTGVCGEQEFMALHIKVSKDKLVVNKIATGPNSVHEIEDDVWQLVKSNDGTLHFVEDGEGIKYEIVVKQDKQDIDGLMYVNGQKAAKFYGHVADGKKLQESGAVLYQMCRQMWDSPSGVLDKSLVN